MMPAPSQWPPAYREALVANHRTRITVELLDIEEKNPVLMTNAILDGEVQVDMDAEVSRSCTLQIADDAGKVNWGWRDTHDYAIYPGRMVRVSHGVYVSDLGDWTDVPVFTGPIVSFRRGGGVVALEAQGKEWLLQDPFVQWNTMHWRKGANILKVITQVLDKKGELNRALPKRTNHRLKKKFGIPRPNNTWPALKFLAKQMDYVIYYRGDGKLVMRPKVVGGSAWNFGDRDMLTEAQWSYDVGQMFNTVNIEYEHGKRTERYTRYASPRANVMSPETLGRNGKPLVMAIFVSSDPTDSQAEADTLARRLLDEGTQVPVTLSFTAVPIPFLEEGQRVNADIDGKRYNFSMRQFSYGLAPGGVMSVNINADQLRKQLRAEYRP